MARLHQLEIRQILQADLREIWSFFQSPLNLRAITPEWLDFQVVSDVPQDMHPGLIIEYRVRPLAGLRSRWVTEITHVRAPHYFVDEQRVGPYRMWHHEHVFNEVAGGVEVIDRVSYVLPFGPLGDLAHAAFVRRRLNTIFTYRKNVLARRFGELKQTSD